VTPSFNIVAGVDNLLDRNYFEHLNLRLRPDGAFPGVQVLSPGITPYFAVEWKY
jgi:outer membrane receptor protein involved in Fe transport